MVLYEFNGRGQAIYVKGKVMTISGDTIGEVEGLTVNVVFDKLLIALKLVIIVLIKVHKILYFCYECKYSNLNQLRKMYYTTIAAYWTQFRTRPFESIYLIK